MKQKPKKIPKTELEGLSHFGDVCLMNYKNPNQVQDFCPHGLARARWYMDNPSSSAADELSAPGCNFSVISEDEDCYCFFKMMANKEGKQFTEEEIGRRLGLSASQVKVILERALLKFKGSPFFKELEELRKSGHLFDNSMEAEEEDIYFPGSLGGNAGYDYDSNEDIKEECELETEEVVP